jgi:hypothetical protein
VLPLLLILGLISPDSRGTLLLACATESRSLSAPPVALADVADPRITEASGIAASRLNPGCYYIHNDSGDSPRVFLIDRTGRVRLEIRLAGAHAVDYEDISMAPGDQPGMFDVCVADIGDNNARRKNVTIYRFPEPPLPDAAGTASRTAADTSVAEVHPTAYVFRYADGPADAEAFCVHPRTGDGYILTKRLTGGSLVYKLTAPWNPREETPLPRLCTVELPASIVGLARIVTAADISPDGRRLAVRCYVNGWEWRLPPDADDADFDRIFATKPVELNLPGEPQGEALCYSPDGTAFLTICEGKSPTLYETAAPAP